MTFWLSSLNHVLNVVGDYNQFGIFGRDHMQSLLSTDSDKEMKGGLHEITSNVTGDRLAHLRQYYLGTTTAHWLIFRNKEDKYGYTTIHFLYLSAVISK